jgi:4'-phosphopantetheinyl transferase
VTVTAAIAVQWCDGGPVLPAATTQAPPPGVTVIGLHGQTERESARLAIRAALTGALAAQCGVAPDRVLLHPPSGSAPSASVELDGGPRPVALAISHDGDLSVAAFCFAGAVGIDVSLVVPVPDWEAVARDYLGPAAVGTLAALPADARDAAFAQAWSEHEARLKSLGLQLEEWRAELAPLLAACTCLPLALPAGYAGYLALAAVG